MERLSIFFLGFLLVIVSPFIAATPTFEDLRFPILPDFVMNGFKSSQPSTPAEKQVILEEEEEEGVVILNEDLGREPGLSGKQKTVDEPAVELSRFPNHPADSVIEPYEPVDREIEGMEPEPVPAE